jgi:hypothetical protein
MHWPFKCILGKEGVRVWAAYGDGNELSGTVQDWAAVRDCSKGFVKKIIENNVFRFRA